MVVPENVIYDINVEDKYPYELTSSKDWVEQKINKDFVLCSFSLYMTTENDYYGSVTFYHNDGYPTFYKTYKKPVSSGKLISDAYNWAQEQNFVPQPDWND